MTKQKLQQDILKNVKLGIKPSDLKKKQQNPPQSKNSVPTVPTNQQLLTPPPTPPLKPRKEDISPSPIEIYSTPPDSPVLKPTKPSKPANNVHELKEQVKYWSGIAQNHLLNLSRTSAELFNAEEKIKDLERQKPASLNKEAEQALIEANQRIRELIKTNEKLQEKKTQLNKTMQTIEKPVKTQGETKQTTFTCSDCQQTKSSQELSRQFSNFSFCRACSVKARKSAEKKKLREPELIQEPQLFTCVACEEKKNEVPNYKKVDISYKTHLIKGKEYPVCASCSPHIKEYNEHENQEFSIGED